MNEYTAAVITVVALCAVPITALICIAVVRVAYWKNTRPAPSVTGNQENTP